MVSSCPPPKVVGSPPSPDAPVLEPVIDPLFPVIVVPGKVSCARTGEAVMNQAMKKKKKKTAFQNPVLEITTLFHLLPPDFLTVAIPFPE